MTESAAVIGTCADYRKPVILAVEDDEVSKELLDKMLADSNYAVVYANDGLDGMRVLAQTETVDLILLDAHMPRMSGFQMLAVLRTSRRYRDIPVIIQTADPTGREWEGAVACIVKPFTEDALRDVIGTALRLSPA